MGFIYLDAQAEYLDIEVAMLSFKLALVVSYWPAWNGPNPLIGQFHAGNFRAHQLLI
jgi:hypothetical protein